MNQISVASVVSSRTLNVWIEFAGSKR